MKIYKWTNLVPNEGKKRAQIKKKHWKHLKRKIKESLVVNDANQTEQKILKNAIKERYKEVHKKRNCGQKKQLNERT